MFIIKNKLGLYIFDNKSVVYNSKEAFEFETEKEAREFLKDIKMIDNAFNIKFWEVIEVKEC